MFGHCRKDVDGEPVRARHVHGHEFNIAVHQSGNEMDVAGEPVELGDDKHGTVLPALCERCMEFRPILLPPALYFDELRRQLSLACHEAGDGFALRVQTQTARALPVGGNPVIGHKLLQ
jgi:hypothetical protein